MVYGARLKLGRGSGADLGGDEGVEFLDVGAHQGGEGGPGLDFVGKVDAAGGVAHGVVLGGAVDHEGEFLFDAGEVAFDFLGAPGAAAGGFQALVEDEDGFVFGLAAGGSEGVLLQFGEDAVALLEDGGFAAGAVAFFEEVSGEEEFEVEPEEVFAGAEEAAAAAGRVEVAEAGDGEVELLVAAAGRGGEFGDDEGPLFEEGFAVEFPCVVLSGFDGGEVAVGGDGGDGGEASPDGPVDAEAADQAEGEHEERGGEPEAVMAEKAAGLEAGIFGGILRSVRQLRHGRR